ILDYLVMLLGSTETIAPYAKDYITYILIAAPFMTAGFLMNNLLRYEGKATLGMIGLTVGALLNIAGDPIFMFVFGLGISGAGISTMLSQVISFCILLSMFLRGKTVYKFSVKNINIKYLPDIVTTGLPSLLRQGLNSLGTVLLNSNAAIYGDAAVAAMSIVSRVIFFTFSVALGVGQGFQPVCGFNYGAKKYDRVKKGFLFACILSQIFIIIMSTVIFIFSSDIVRIFRDDNTVVQIGARALVLQGISQLFMPFCMIIELALQCIGNRFKASFLSTLKSGLFFIPLLLLLSNLRGLSGIQEAQPLSIILAFIPSLIFAIGFFKNLSSEKQE
ncbi:MAG: MATE family efflux transporter, partial [Ruminococcus sp.]|nr:MATE family efflux transporter [Ruminococcus sp.]